ncbi:MAG: hypothetical protein RR978_03995 [Oscillospiraceae bacterium]
MKKLTRFHWIFALKYIKYSLLLCVVPMIRAVINFDMESLFTALTQDAAILVFMAVIAVLLWFNAGYVKGEGNIDIYEGLFIKRKHSILLKSLAVVETVRPLSFRIFGASKVILYFKTNKIGKTTTLYLSKKDAEAFAHSAMPVKQDVSVFEPAGAERLAFVMLSANILTSSLFAIVTVNRLTDVLGKNAGNIAWERFSRLELWFEHFLPAGFAFATALLFLAFTFSVLYSIFRTAGFKVCRNGGVLISKGGLVTKIERRFWCAAITACDVRVTPAARLLRRYPVFLYAGSFHAADAPVFAFKNKNRALLHLLLPEFTLEEPEFKAPKTRSIFQYIWLPASVFAVFTVLYIVARSVLPPLSSLFLFPMLLSFLSCILSCEGYCRENIRLNKNATVGICYTRFFTRHDVCVLVQDLALRTRQHPISLANGYADLYLYLPCMRRLRVRGMQAYAAKTFNLPY